VKTNNDAFLNNVTFISKINLYRKMYANGGKIYEMH
jgi:hypothetical protein